MVDSAETVATKGEVAGRTLPTRLPRSRRSAIPHTGRAQRAPARRHTVAGGPSSNGQTADAHSGVAVERVAGGPSSNGQIAGHQYQFGRRLG